jgi:hypothetical protein
MSTCGDARNCRGCTADSDYVDTEDGGRCVVIDGGACAGFNDNNSQCVYASSAAQCPNGLSSFSGRAKRGLSKGPVAAK